MEWVGSLCTPAQEKCVDIATPTWICVAVSLHTVCLSASMAFFHLAFIVSLISGGAIASKIGGDARRQNLAIDHTSGSKTVSADTSDVIYLFQNGTAETNKVGFFYAPHS